MVGIRTCREKGRSLLLVALTTPLRKEFKLNYIKNVDTICILVDIESYENNAKKIINYLEEQKNNAKLSDKTNYKHTVTIGNMSFQIFGNGTKGYSYILHNDGYQINISQFRSSLHSFYPIQIRISSEFLWSIGLYNAWNNIYKWLEYNFGKIIDTKVYRIDLCLHTSDMDFISDYQTVYKGRFKKYLTNFNGLNINSICFGTRKGKGIYCRIYNKTLEIKETKSKYWFYDIWKNNNIDIENVWNLEFELKSEFLRELQLSTIEDIFYSIPNLWKYCTEQWLVKVDRINTRIERCPINKQWLEIQKVYDEFRSNEFIKREKQISMDAEILIPSIVGNITSYCARKNNINMEQAFNILYKDTKKYLRNKETDFKSEVLSKKKILQKNIDKNCTKEE